MRGAYLFAVAATLLFPWTACVGSDPTVGSPDDRDAAVSEAGAPSDAGPPPSGDAAIGDRCAALSRQSTMYCPTTAEHDQACAPGQSCCAGTGCVAAGSACTGGYYQCFSDQQCGNGLPPKCCVGGSVELSARGCGGAVGLQTATLSECSSACDSSTELELCDPDILPTSCPPKTTCVRGVVTFGKYVRTVGFCQVN